MINHVVKKDFFSFYPPHQMSKKVVKIEQVWSIILQYNQIDLVPSYFK